MLVLLKVISFCICKNLVVKPLKMNITIYLQAHFNCMVMLVLLVVIAFIIIFVEVGGYSKVSNVIMDCKDINITKSSNLTLEVNFCL